MNESFTKVIRADKSWLSFDFKSLIHYRDLLFLMIRREFVSKYKQTLLGPAWFVVQPALMAVTFVFVFSETMKIPTDRVPPVLFYFSGIIIWNFLSGALGSISVSMLHHAELCKKALEKVGNPNVLINIVSRRVRQMNIGGGGMGQPLTDAPASMGLAAAAEALELALQNTDGVKKTSPSQKGML